MAKADNKSDVRLTAIEDFNDYRRGMQITDPVEIENILKSEHSHKVVRSIVKE